MSVIISLGKINAGDTLELLKLAYFGNKQALINGFKKVGILIKDESDLNLLNELSIKGEDISGKIKDSNNNPLSFSVIKIAKEVIITKQQMMDSKIKIAK
jgi:hypothetical protein